MSSSKVKKNWWPVGIAVSSAFTLILFQNCSRVQLAPMNPSLATSNSPLNQDLNDNPAQMPGSENNEKPN